MKTKTDKETLTAEEAVEQEFLQKQVGESEPASAEQRNVYTQQMSSTVEANVSNEDFWKIKLHS